LSADQYSHSRSGLSGNRLPTIPASPYIEQPEFVESPTHGHFQPTAPPVPEHAEMPAELAATAELTHRPHPGSGDAQIHRKPVPVYETK
jgi:CCR4-NOT transcriptional complex subunit CAF120